MKICTPWHNHCEDNDDNHLEYYLSTNDFKDQNQTIAEIIGLYSQPNQFLYTIYGKYHKIIEEDTIFNNNIDVVKKIVESKILKLGYQIIDEKLLVLA